MNRSNTAEFIKKAVKIHGNRYDYSLVDYQTAKTKIEIICENHGIFEQTPNGHLSGWNCNKCGLEEGSKKQRRTIQEFVQAANKIHNKIYNYSLVEYINDGTKVKIICPVHGIFEMMPTNHLFGKQGCRSCNMSSSFQQENWLDELGIDNKYRNKRVNLIDGTYIIADAFDKDKRVVYEYWGDYWHGNPTKYDREYINPHCKCTMGKLYDMYVEKKTKIIDNGYTLVEIWESDYRDAGKKV